MSAPIDVGLGASAAQALSTSQTSGVNAGTVFNFNSTGARGDTYEQELGASSAAEAKATASGKGSAVANDPESNVSGSSSTNYLPWIVAALAVGYVIYKNR